MTKDEWLRMKRDFCYQRGLAYSNAGNASTTGEFVKWLEEGRKFDRIIKEHEAGYSRMVTK